MPAQSSLKIAVLLTYTKRIRLGAEQPDRRVALLSEDNELGSGILRYLVPNELPGRWQHTDSDGPRTLADLGEAIYDAWSR